MKRYLRIFVKGLLGLIAFLLLVSGVLITWVYATWEQKFPDIPKVSLKSSKEPKVLARGEYLFRAVIGCPTCHAMRPAYHKEGAYTSPSGGKLDFGPLATLYPPNITPDKKTGKPAKYTDAQIGRIIRYGLRPDHSPVYMKFAVGPMSDEDLIAVISYLRTLKPVKNTVKQHKFTLFGKVLIRLLMPYFLEYRPKIFWKAPPFVREGKISVARGRYLADGPASCRMCHMKYTVKRGTVVSLAEYGGAPLGDPDPSNPGMEVVAPNLTPDPTTGHIYKWTEEMFLRRFRTPRTYKGSHMPWESFQKMTDADIRSIYRYLKTIKPYKNRVVIYRKIGSGN